MDLNFIFSELTDNAAIFFTQSLTYIGALICLIAWNCKAINTKPLSIQLTYVTYFFIWTFMYVLDSTTVYEHTMLTLITRLTIFLTLVFTTAFAWSITQYVKNHPRVVLDERSLKFKIKDKT